MADDQLGTHEDLELQAAIAMSLVRSNRFRIDVLSYRTVPPSAVQSNASACKANCDG